MAADSLSDEERSSNVDVQQTTELLGVVVLGLDVGARALSATALRAKIDTDELTLQYQQPR